MIVGLIVLLMSQVSNSWLLLCTGAVEHTECRGWQTKYDSNSNGHSFNR